jgi:hypothetical protein
MFRPLNNPHSKSFLMLTVCVFCLAPRLSALPDQSGTSVLAWPLVLGAEEGLFAMNPNNRIQTLWTGGSVKKILRQGSLWVMLSDKGVLVSSDLRNWEERGRGLPVQTIKIFSKGEKSFQTIVQEIKDLEVHPQKAGVMVCAVKNGIYLTRDGGLNWESLGMPPSNTNGIKAVAVCNLPGPSGRNELTVLCSHGIYGVFYRQPDSSSPAWGALNAGLEKLETTDNPDEVSDLKASVFQTDVFQTASFQADENAAAEIYAAQSFRRRVYRLSWAEKRFNLIWTDGQAFGALDSLCPGNTALRFLQDGALNELDLKAIGVPKQRKDLALQITNMARALKIQPVCAVIKENSLLRDSEILTLSELWLLDTAPLPDGQVSLDRTPYQSAVRKKNPAGREGLYLPVNHAMGEASLAPYLDLIKKRNLDMVVIDMKDDYGRLRFTPQNEALSGWGRVFRPVDIDSFLKEMKGQGIYTIARVVVFKDPETARKENAKYAVWDSANSKAWEGYYDTRRKKLPPGEEEETNPALKTEILPAESPGYETVRTYYDEKWVDPYAEEIWEYIAVLSDELHSRGFDEIQYDYIRFPTDGANLGDARYRFKENGMDMDSAILSFLRHVRARVKAPISVDIYGANGWYRTGARTGQEVELLSPYVDVICPMYYPSHFEQSFLAQDPPELRPYRIYHQGTLRTRIIARGKITVRPWAQAFYLNVSYDRKYYNVDYVRRQTEGVRDAGGGGLTYWNNSGRYEDIPSPRDISKAESLRLP